MTIKRETLEAAASADILKYQQIDNLLVFLVQYELKATRQSESGRFNAALLFYLGGMLVLGAAFLFAYMAVNALGLGALLWFSVLYALCAMGVAHWFAQRSSGFMASLFSLLAIGLAGSAMFAAQSLQGNPSGASGPMLAHTLTMDFDGRWLAIELAALATSLGLLLWLRLPFLVLPSAYIAWLIGMDLLPTLILKANSIAGIGLPGSIEELRQGFTLVVGLALITLGLYLDARQRPVNEGFAFWSYFGGLLALSVAVLLLTGNHMFGRLLFLALHAGLIVAGLILGRRIFEAFGGAGIALVLGEMTWAMFRQSVAFVPVLTVLCLAMLAIGLWWWRREPAFAPRLRRRMLPRHMKVA